MITIIFVINSQVSAWKTEETAASELEIFNHLRPTFFLNPLFLHLTL